MKSGIYEIRNTANGKRYIGSAASLNGRKAVHLSYLRRGIHHNRHLQAAWTKYGEDAFEFSTLLFCDKGNLLMYEQTVMDAVCPEYNIAPTAGNCFGVKHSEEARRKRSLRNMGNTFAAGRSPSAECRASVAAANRRRAGTPRSPEAVASTAAKHRGMKRSAETRAKIAARAKGRNWTDEARAKLSAATKGRKLSEEQTRHLVGNRHAAGRVKTPEERANLSQKLRDRWAEKRAAGIPWR